MSSSSGQARRAACWPTGCPPIPSAASCCWRPAGGTRRSARACPAAWISLINSEVDWGYHTVPQRRCFGRRLVWPRGKLVGGSGAINALIYMRGDAVGLRSLAAKGAEGWGWQDVLPVFREDGEERAASAAARCMATAASCWSTTSRSTTRPSTCGSKAAQEAGLPLQRRFQRAATSSAAASSRR